MNLKVYTLVYVILLFFILSCQEKKKVDFKPDEYLVFSINQVNRALDSLHDVTQAPRNIPVSSINWHSTSLSSWTSGFWPGILWNLYDFSRDKQLLTEAQKWTYPFLKLVENGVKNHDLGFMIFCSLGNGYRISKNEEYKYHIIEAADTLATLYNPKAGTILSWPGRRKIGNIQTEGSMNHNTIMDNMMNLELLFWASKNGGGQYLYEIAQSHAETTMRDFLRADYSSYHVVIYDSITGKIGHKLTHQGYSDESAWARGQAWGIYGFTTAFKETGKKEFFDTAINMAKFFINNLPQDYVPFWDFNAPGIPDEEKDASSAAIAASALIDLLGLSNDPEEQEWLFEKSKKILQSLSENYLSDGTNHAVLWHSVGNMNSNSEVDEPIVYADYFYIEALLKLKKRISNSL